MLPFQLSQVVQPPWEINWLTLNRVFDRGPEHVLAIPTEDAAFEFSHYELDGTLIINLWAHALFTSVCVCVCVCESE